MRRHRTHHGVARWAAAAAALTLVLTACGDTTTEPDDPDPTGDPGNGQVTQPGEGVTVTLGRANWDTGYMQAAIFKQLLEELGYDVADPSANELGAAQFYPALAQGDVDVWANGWFPLHGPQMDAELPDGTTVGDNVTAVGVQVEAGALQGYLVDRATAEEHGITSMADLEDPDVAALFDVDGDGVADLIGCPDGWGCNVQIDAHINGTDEVEPLAWGENVRQVVGEYSALMSDVISRINRGEPALFYTWTPNWTIHVLTPGEDVLWLESPEQDDVAGQTTVEGVEGCTNDPCQMGWTPNDIRVVANSDFLEANPAAATLFEQVQISLADIAEQNARMNDADTYAESDVAQDAADWIEANRAQVDQWLDAARAAA